MCLKLIYITGKIEVARMNSKGTSFSTTFQELVGEIENAKKHLEELSLLVQKNKETERKYTKFRESLNDLIDEIQMSFHAAVN